MVGHDQPQHSVTEQLQALVGRPGTSLGAVGTVRERLVEQVIPDGEPTERPAEPLTRRLRLDSRIAQAAPTFPLT
jgi:hypothetical protein